MKKKPKLRKQRGVYFIEFYHSGKRRRQSLGTRDEYLANKEYNKFCYEYENGILPDSGKIALGRYLNIKRKEYKIKKTADRVRRIERVFYYLIDIFGEKRNLDDIKPSEANDFITYRISLGNRGPGKKKVSLSNKTINNEIQIIKKLFEEAKNEQYIKENPFEYLEYLEYVPNDRDAFTKDELDKIFENAPPIYSRFYYFLLLTGCRKSEAVNLKWEHVDFKNKTINIKREYTKTKKPKQLPLVHELESLLNSIPTPRNDYVFLNRNGRKHQNISHIFTLFKRKIGLRENVTLHSFRHTAATFLLRMQGVNMYLVKTLLGHSDIRTTTNIYGHIAANDLAEITNEYSNSVMDIAKINAKIKTNACDIDSEIPKDSIPKLINRPKRSIKILSSNCPH